MKTGEDLEMLHCSLSLRIANCCGDTLVEGNSLIASDGLSREAAAHASSTLAEPHRIGK
jgi:hypothetical protein